MKTERRMKDSCNRKLAGRLMFVALLVVMATSSPAAAAADPIGGKVVFELAPNSTDVVRVFRIGLMDEEVPIAQEEAWAWVLKGGAHEFRAAPVAVANWRVGGGSAFRASTSRSVLQFVKGEHGLELAEGGIDLTKIGDLRLPRAPPGEGEGIFRIARTLGPETEGAMGLSGSVGVFGRVVGSTPVKVAGKVAGVAGEIMIANDVASAVAQRIIECEDAIYTRMHREEKQRIGAQTYGNPILNSYAWNSEKKPPSVFDLNHPPVLPTGTFLTGHGKLEDAELRKIASVYGPEETMNAESFNRLIARRVKDYAGQPEPSEMVFKSPRTLEVEKMFWRLGNPDVMRHRQAVKNAEPVSTWRAVLPWEWDWRGHW
jgi:hypothetical protein